MELADDHDGLRDDKIRQREDLERPVNQGVHLHTSQIRQLVKSSGIYALSSLAAPLVSLVLAPFLTRHLSHADYGALAVLNTAIALVAGITQLGLNSAFFARTTTTMNLCGIGQTFCRQSLSYCRSSQCPPPSR